MQEYAGLVTGKGIYLVKQLMIWLLHGELKAPIVIGRDHLDCGSVASPNRETEEYERWVRCSSRLANT